MPGFYYNVHVGRYYQNSVIKIKQGAVLLDLNNTVMRGYFCLICITPPRGGHFCQTCITPTTGVISAILA